MTKGPKPRTLFARLSEKFLIGDDCWEWTAARSSTGYGNFWISKGHWRHAHCVLYEIMVGPIPEGTELDHLCRNRGCVRPSHLEPVVHQVNVDRGDGARRAHCPAGHAMIGENVRHDRTSRSYRCRICQRARDRARWPQRKAQRKARRALGSESG